MAERKPLVYICSPFKGSDGNYERNRQRAIEYCKDAAAQGVIPLAPHTIFTQYLNDAVPAEREIGLRLGIDLLQDYCTELWVYGDEISQGMQAEIDLCRQHGIPVSYKTYSPREVAPVEVLTDTPAQAQLSMFQPYAKSVTALTEHLAKYKIPPELRAVADGSGSFLLLKSGGGGGLSLDWVKAFVAAGVPITALDVKASFFRMLEQQLSTLTPAQREDARLLQRFDLARESARLAPLHITLPELRGAVRRELERLLSGGEIGRLLLDANLMQHGIENAVAIRLQCPDATRLYTQNQLGKLGVKPRSGQKPVYIYSTTLKSYFEREGQRVPLTDATGAEQIAIVSDKIPLTHEVQYGLNRLFSVEQLDLDRAQWEALAELETTATCDYETLVKFAAMTRMAGSLGIKTRETPMTGLTLDSFYDRESNTILMNSELHESLKVPEYLRSLSAAVVSLTSTAAPEMQTLEAQLLSARLNLAFGHSVSAPEAAGLSAVFRHASAESTFSLEATLAKVNRAAVFVATGVRQVAQAEAAEPAQATREHRQFRSREEKPVTTDELQNFIQQIQ